MADISGTSKSSAGMITDKNTPDMMADVTALGEILIDFTPAGVSGQGGALFEKNPGGAPANVAVCVSKLGGKSAFIGKAGEDMFGVFLESVLRGYNVDTRGFKFSKEHNTTLAFVELDENGDRSFSFYRNPGADTVLMAEEVDFELIKNSRIFHFGSLSLTNEPSRGATIEALRYAKQNRVTVSYDPNLRPALWKSMESAKNNIKSAMGYADIIKISEEELLFLTGEEDLCGGTHRLYMEYGTGLILVTRGPKGAFYRFGDETGEKKTVKNIRVVDTTGAGDAFLGGFLFSMTNRGIFNTGKLDSGTIEDMMLFSNAVASLCVSKKGAIPAMPDFEQVINLIELDSHDSDCRSMT